MGESTLGGAAFSKKMYSFLGIFLYILGATLLWFHLVFWKIYKMVFDTKAYNIILLIFQIKVVFQQFFSFKRTSIHLNFLKSHESN
jgi:hypothetical protein